MFRWIWALPLMALSCQKNSQPSDGPVDASIAAPATSWEVFLEADLKQTHRLLSNLSINLPETDTLRLRFVPAPSHCRVRLLDEFDRVLPSDDLLTEQSGELEYALQLQSTLVRDRLYTLRIDTGLALTPPSLQSLSRTVSLQIR